MHVHQNTKKEKCSFSNRSIRKNNIITNLMMTCRLAQYLAIVSFLAGNINEIHIVTLNNFTIDLHLAIIDRFNLH